MPWISPSTSASSVKIAIARSATSAVRLLDRSMSRICAKGVSSCAWSTCSARGGALLPPPVASRHPSSGRRSVRIVHHEPHAGEGMVAMLEHCARHLGGQARRPDRAEHALAQIRESVEHGGDEHIACHAADGVEVEVHGMRDEAPSPLVGEGWGEGEASVRAGPLTLTLSREGRGKANQTCAAS